MTDELKVLSRTERIIVEQSESLKLGPGKNVTVVRVVEGGPVGPPGVDGRDGINGQSAGRRWYGEGPPGLVVGAAPGDEYLDILTGDLYNLQ